MLTNITINLTFYFIERNYFKDFMSVVVCEYGSPDPCIYLK